MVKTPNILKYEVCYVPQSEPFIYVSFTGVSFTFLTPDIFINLHSVYFLFYKKIVWKCVSSLS